MVDLFLSNIFDEKDAFIEQKQHKPHKNGLQTRRGEHKLQNRSAILNFVISMSLEL